MRRRLPVAVLVAALLALTALGAARAAGAGFALVPGGNVLFPDRSYVIALDQERRLSTADVSVEENGKAMKGVTVGNGNSGVGTVLLIDASNSMKSTIGEAMAAARAYAARTPGAPLSIVTFNSRPDVRLPFTTNEAAIKAALANNPKLGEGTRIWDALSAAQAQIGGTALGAARIVLVSDGADVGSTTDKSAVTDALVRDNVRVYAVGIDSPAFDPGELQSLARATGGDYALASSTGALRGIYDQLGTKASKEYVVRYRSPAAAGQRVAVAVGVNGLGTVRTNYTTPSIGSATPYEPRLVDRVTQSWLLMVVVALLVVLLVSYTVVKVAELLRNRQLRSRLAAYDSLADVEAEKRKAEVEALMNKRTSRRLRFDDWDWTERVAVELELGGIKATPQRMLVYTVLGTVVLALFLAALFAPWAFLFAIAVPFIVRGEVGRRSRKARDAFAEQLPDNLEVMASALRAGHSLVGAMSVVVEEAPEPSREEFRRIVTDEQLGIPLDETLELTARRMDSRDMEQVAVVALLQRETGGNMAEVLDRVIENIRGRQEVRRLVRTLTAQGRLSRWILSLLPVAVLLGLLLINPDYMQPLFHQLIGQVALVLATISVIVGSLVINKIVKIRI